MEMGFLYTNQKIHKVSKLIVILLHLNFIRLSFPGVFDMMENESDTLRFVSSLDSSPEKECDKDQDCVAIVKVCEVFVNFYKEINLD